MKKSVFALLLCLLLMTAALAEEAIICTQVGRQAVDRGGDTTEIAIMRLDFAGENIPSLYALTCCPWLYAEGQGWSLEDVNFDGHEDLVLVTENGASNTLYTFYLWDAEAGAYAWCGGEEVWNYQLYPAQGIVRSYATNGWAGLLHENRVYAWDATGRSLTLLRSSEWSTLVETGSETVDGRVVYTERYDDSTVVETYIDHTTGDITTSSFPANQYENEQFLAERFLAEDDFLGLEVEAEDMGDGSNG